MYNKELIERICANKCYKKELEDFCCDKYDFEKICDDLRSRKYKEILRANTDK